MKNYLDCQKFDNHCVHSNNTGVISDFESYGTSVLITNGKIRGRKINRAILISPRNGRNNQFGMIEPTVSQGFMIIATLLKHYGVNNVLAIDEAISPIFESEYLKKIILEAPIVAIGGMTAHEDAGLYWLREAKKKNPNCITIAGGMGPTAQPQKSLLNGADIVLRGEAETIMERLVEILRNGGDLNQLKGVAWKEGKNFFDTGYAPPLEDLDEVPLVDWSLLYQREKAQAVTISFSRGCPFDCSFCTVSETFGRRRRSMSVERALEHIKGTNWLKSPSIWLRGHKNGLVFFGDDHIALNVKWAEELFGRIAKLDLKKDLIFSSEMRIDTFKPKLLNLMRQAGATSVWTGFESDNDANLLAINKRQTVESIRVACENAKRAKIAVRGMCILGLDYDELGVGKRMASFAMQNEMALIIPYIRSPLYGTRDTALLEREGRIISGIPDTYRTDAGHVSFRPKHMTAIQLTEEL